MRRTDDVFYLTLIDFLLQVFFFGLLIFVVFQALHPAPDPGDEEAKAKLLEMTGVSSLTELTDYLSKLMPLDKLRGTKDFIDRNGGQEAVKKALDAVARAGGVEKVDGMQGELDVAHRQLEAAWGKPSCLPNVVADGKEQPKTIAKAVLTDDTISLVNVEPEMSSVLRELGLTPSEVERLTPSEFRKKFSPLTQSHPTCRYFLSVSIQTKLIEPMRAVWSAFRVQ